MNGEKESEGGYAQRAKWDKAVLDFAAGEVTGSEAAQAYTNGDGGLEKSTFGGGHVQNVAAVEDDIELQKSGEEEKVSITGNGEAKNAVRGDQFALGPEISQEINAKTFGRVGRGNFADTETGDEPDDRTRQKNYA